MNIFAPHSSPGHQRRPSTSMTQQTELSMIHLQDTPIYSNLERDYEDLDDKDEPDTELVPSPPPPTSHHQNNTQSVKYLPTVKTEQAKGYDNLVPIGELDPNSTPAKRALGLLAKDRIAEQMSVNSSHSDDFTGPFMLPHKIKFGDSSSRECQSDNHTYKCLDLSTIEPDQNYSVPAATKLKQKRKGRNP